MKKILVNLGLVMSLMLLVACGGGSQSPSEVIEAYLNHSTKGEVEEAYNYLAKPVKEKMSLEQMKETMKVAQNPMAQMFLSRMTHKVVEVKEDGDKATASIEQNLPDLQKIIGAIPTLKKKYPNVKSEDDMIEAMEEHFGGSIPTITQTVTYELVKEEGEWKVIPSNQFGM